MGAIAIVVEGQGDEEALPILVRAILASAQIWDVTVANPVRLHRGHFPRPERLRRAAKFALDQEADADQALLVMCDADDDCPVDLAAEWANALAGLEPFSVVLANREYEAWLLASQETLHSRRHIPQLERFDGDPDAVRDAKGRISSAIGRRYMEVVDQPGFTAHVDLELAESRSRSFQKFRKEVLRLAGAVREP